MIDPLTGLPFPEAISSPRTESIRSRLTFWQQRHGPISRDFQTTRQTRRARDAFDQINVRVDHSFGSLGRLFGRWSGQPGDASTPRFVTVDPSVSDAFGQNIVIGFDAGKSNFFNSLRFGHTQQNTGSENTLPEGLTPSSLGFPENQFQVMQGVSGYRILEFRTTQRDSMDSGKEEVHLETTNHGSTKSLMV